MTASPAHFVRLFQPRFAPAVESGAKLHTIRPLPKRLPRSGDTISLRAWKGKSYRSKQRILREATVTSVEGIIIHADGVEFSPGTPRCYWLGEGRAGTRDIFAWNDGFRDWLDMKTWFQATHRLPFTGIIIYWSPLP